MKVICIKEKWEIHEEEDYPKLGKAYTVVEALMNDGILFYQFKEVIRKVGKRNVWWDANAFVLYVSFKQDELESELKEIFQHN